MDRPDSLFRPEALAERDRRLSGRVILPQRPVFIAGALSGMLACAVVIGLVVWGQYAPRQTVSGYLDAIGGVAKVHVSRPGTLLSVDVSDGDVVTAGDTLVTAAVEQHLAEGDGVQTEILNALQVEVSRLQDMLRGEQALFEAQRVRLGNRIIAMRRELAATEAERGVLREQAGNMNDLLQRTSALAEAGYVTEADVLAQRERALTHQRSLRAVEASLARLSTAIQDAQAELDQLPLQSGQRLSGIGRELAQMRRQQASMLAERAYSVIAPVSGRITALQAGVGSAVTPVRPLMVIVPDSAQLQVNLLIPSRSIGFVEEGQEVRVRFSAFPYQQYGIHRATVVSVSRTTLRPDEWPTGLPVVENVYRVVARLDRQAIETGGSRLLLQAGMLLEADILRESRPLWAWLLEPVIAFRGRLWSSGT